jgi:hypothetical protein
MNLVIQFEVNGSLLPNTEYQLSAAGTAAVPLPGDIVVEGDNAWDVSKRVFFYTTKEVVVTLVLVPHR